MLLNTSNCPGSGDSLERVVGGTRFDRDARAHSVLLGMLLIGLLALCADARVHAADVINGAKIYAKHCAACHGPAGISIMPGAPHLKRGERMMQPDLALLASLKAGKNAMPAYVGMLTDREILDVIAYSRSLR